MNVSMDNRDTMSSSSETSQLLTDQNTLMSSLAANYIKLDSLPKPYDSVFELIQRYLQFELFIDRACALDKLTESTIKQVYQVLKYYIQDEQAKELFDEGFLCSCISRFLSACVKQRVTDMRLSKLVRLVVIFLL